MMHHDIFSLARHLPIKTSSFQMSRSTILFSIHHRVGELKKVLSIFQDHRINLQKIVSRPSRDKKTVEFSVDVSKDVDQEQFKKLLGDLRKQCARVKYLGGAEIPWFPRKMSDLDQFSHKVLEAGSELQSDHPGFNDQEYRERRMMICEIAKNYRHGQKIPTVNYTKKEIETWGKIYRKLVSLYPTHACKQLNYVFPLLEEHCGYSDTNIPQLQDVSDFLKDATGFTIRPVAGLLSARDFLNGLAFRVFHSTQYIRHHSKPDYTPEPDVVHELMGHVPLFCDPDFADFSQEIGLASIGASDDVITQLVRCYWYTVEFGLCKEDGKVKAYGAGLLSSFGELQYCLTDKPEIVPFDPYVASQRDYPVTTYQPLYFLANSFEEAKHQMREFSRTSQRPFAIRYNPYTQSIEVLDSRKKLANLSESIQSQMYALSQAIAKIDSTELDKDPLD